MRFFLRTIPPISAGAMKLGPAIAIAAAIAAALVVGAPLPSLAKLAGDASAGARIYKEKCARCHGASGKGDGPDLKRLHSDATPDDWTDQETNHELSDVFIVNMITKGGEANGKSHVMPAFKGKLNDQQVADLVAFIRSLAK